VHDLIDRVILFSNPKFHLHNFCFVIKILLENDYPLEFIFDNIKKQLKNAINFKKKKRDNNNIENTEGGREGLHDLLFQRFPKNSID